MITPEFICPRCTKEIYVGDNLDYDKSEIEEEEYVLGFRWCHECGWYGPLKEVKK